MVLHAGASNPPGEFMGQEQAMGTGATRCSSPKRFDPIGLAYGAIAACFQGRVDLGSRQQMNLAWVSGDQECLGSRGFDVSQFLLDIVRDAGKPQRFVGERD